MGSEEEFWQAYGGWTRLAGDYAALGVSIEHHEFEVGEPIDWTPSFHPDSLEICLNLEGTCRFRTPLGRQEFSGQSMLVYSTVHQPDLTASRQSGCHHFVTLEYSKELLERLFSGATGSGAAQTGFWDPGRLAGVVEFALPPDAGLIDGSVETSQCPARKAMLLARAFDILSRTLTMLSHRQEFFCTRWQRTASERIHATKTYLRKHLDEPLDLKRLASEVGCGAHYLCRTFSSVEGYTISQFLQRERMRYAARLLEQQRMNVTEVALEVGYTSLSHFCRTFARTFGCKPGAYNGRKRAGAPG